MTRHHKNREREREREREKIEYDVCKGTNE